MLAGGIARRLRQAEHAVDRMQDGTEVLERLRSPGNTMPELERARVRRGQTAWEAEIRMGKPALDLSGWCAWVENKPPELTTLEWPILGHR